MGILIKNGRVINPANNFDGIADVYVEDNRVSEIGRDLQKDVEDVIDATGCFVMPGLIDLHVHLRDPGLTYKEDICSGSEAAANGGYTTICCMPNTKPVVDNVEVVEYIVDTARNKAPINVLPVGAVTKGMLGKEVTDIFAMKSAGICAISEDGKSVMDSGVYRIAMENSVRAELPVLAHCEDINLVCGGVINKGDKSEEFGVNGISNAVEDIIVARDILLAKETGAKLHLCHCSTIDSVEMVRIAKEEGLKVTAEVCPHHFAMCTDDMKNDDSNYKMNPPLRTREDMEALIKGLSEDIMDVILLSPSLTVRRVHRTSLMRKYNIEFDPDIRIGEDLFFSCCTLLVCKYIAYTQQDGYFYRQNREGRLTFIGDERIMDLFKIFDKLDIFIEKNKLKKNWVLSHLAINIPLHQLYRVDKNLQCKYLNELSERVTLKNYVRYVVSGFVYSFKTRFFKYFILNWICSNTLFVAMIFRKIKPISHFMLRATLFFRKGGFMKRFLRLGC